MALLEGIKRNVDPNNLFICNAGIGSGSPYDDETFASGVLASNSMAMQALAAALQSAEPCEAAAPCFDDDGCSAFDRSTQMWTDIYEPCNEGALDCASSFPDSSCFSDGNGSSDGGEENEGAGPSPVTTASPVASPIESGGDESDPTSVDVSTEDSVDSGTSVNSSCLREGAMASLLLAMLLLIV